MSQALPRKGNVSTGAIGKVDHDNFEPEFLTIVTDPASDLYDERADLPIEEKWVENVMQLGVMSDITVRVNGTRPLREDEVQYNYAMFPNAKAGDIVPNVEVVFGRQRTRWACEANRRMRELDPKATCWTIGAKIQKGADELLLFKMLISENEVRQQDSLVTRARKMQRLLARNGGNIQDAAVIFGCSISTVKNNMALLELHVAVVTGVANGKIGLVTALKEYGAMPRDQQKTVYEAWLQAGVTKGAAGRAMVREIADEIGSSGAGQEAAPAAGNSLAATGAAGGKARVTTKPSNPEIGAGVSMRSRKFMVDSVENLAANIKAAKKALKGLDGDDLALAERNLRDLNVAHAFAHFWFGRDEALDKNAHIRDALCSPPPEAEKKK